MKEEKKDGDEYLLPNEVARKLRRSTGTLTNWRVQGKGPKFVVHNKRIMYPRKSFDAYCAMFGQEFGSTTEHKES